MITTKHIAQQLDLSVSTVGRALANDPRISAATTRRVLTRAKKLGYIPSGPAQILRGGSSHLVGLLVPDIRNSFFSMIAHVLSKRFESEGLHLALSIAEDNPVIEAQRVREMVSARVAGIVIVPSASPTSETISLLRTVPHIQLLRHVPALKSDWFGIDDRVAMQEATTHLLELGHRRIAYIGDIIFPTGKARYEGFKQAFRGTKSKFEPTLVELGPASVLFGAAATSRLLQSKRPPTALITASVPVTMGVIDQLETRKIDVPGKLSVIGFGDAPWQKWWRSGLTTIRLPVESLANGCGAWFLRSLQTRTIASTVIPHREVISSTLVIRGSTEKL